jgi:hypothetical protein
MGIGIHSHGRVEISDMLKRLLHESSGVTLTIKVKKKFSEVNIYLLLDKLPKNYSILH